MKPHALKLIKSLEVVVTFFYFCYDREAEATGVKVTSSADLISPTIPGLSTINMSSTHQVSPSSVTVKTAEIQDVKLNKNKDVRITKSQILFNLPSLCSDQSKEIKLLKVIIKKWQANDNVETLRNTDNNNITSYEHSKQGRLPYVTYLQEGYESGKLIVIGNGSEIEKNRRKRATTRYQNAPLEEGTEYALFVRVFYNDLETIYFNSEVLRQSTEKVGDSKRRGINVLFIIVTIVMLLVVVFGVFIMRRCKMKRNKRINKKERRDPQTDRDPVYMNAAFNESAGNRVDLHGDEGINSDGYYESVINTRFGGETDDHAYEQPFTHEIQSHYMALNPLDRTNEENAYQSLQETN